MSDYLSRLVARTSSATPRLQPRLPARFEPPNRTDAFQPQDVQGDASTTPVAGPTSQQDQPAPPGVSREAEPEPVRGRQTLRTREPADTRVPPANRVSHAFVPTVTEMAPQAQPELANRHVRQVREEPDLHRDVPHAAESSESLITSADVSESTERFVQPLVHSVETSIASPTGDETTEVMREPASEPHVAAQNRSERSPETTVVGRHAMTRRSDDTPAKDHAAPIIKVRIGRIEVRAATPPQSPRPAATKPVPTLTLKDYLKNLREGRR